MISYRVSHETLYSYSDQVAVSHNVAHLLPRECPGQHLSGVELKVDPTPGSVSWFSDYFGNASAYFVVDTPHDRLRVLAESRVDVEARAELDPLASDRWEEVSKRMRAPADDESLFASEYLFDSPFVAASSDLEAYGRASFLPDRPLVDAAWDLCRRIFREFQYDPEATTLATPLHEALAERRGVCQDFAHVMIGALRSRGLAARYVSGYIRSAAPPPDPSTPSSPSSPSAPSAGKGGGASASAPRASASKREDDDLALVGSDASHAWVSVYCPRNGWVDFDPTNDMIPSDRHVVLAWGRDYDDVSPLQGVTLGGGLQTVGVGVSMRPISDG